jgi:hypothetical protein
MGMKQFKDACAENQYLAMRPACHVKLRLVTEQKRYERACLGYRQGE